MGKHRWVVLAVGLALAMPAIAACATPSGTDRPSDSAGVGSDPDSGAPGAGSTGNPGGTKSPGEENPSDMLDPQPGTPTTLRGTPSDGVEAGCVILQADDGKSYLLLGGDRQVITSGARIEVSVLVQPDLMTTCQQGIPATVLTVRKI